MAGLDPAIRAFLIEREQDVDARVKPGHDEECASLQQRYKARRISN
jgi:hypothetical protein